ncbi:MAG: tRNA (adenosine(37)-N6)-threonylcarbamoyltransferase complex dimerization subunit type 1 TsaB [Chloroflexi bacterium]|nr:tRNA (adenosine(37)-N6)-threonylcarbamoyltransferase complex dimerization subunit type 1 TsaB [Chloroflexota bacterium]
MILAIDSATRWAGLALHDGTAVIAEHGWRCANNHTIELSPAINELLSRAELTPSDLSGIAVAIGPGSYTGLRVGLALAKGLALANGLPIIGAPTLDIVAASFGQRDGQLVVVAEAGRRRISLAAYEWRDGAGWQLQRGPENAAWDEALAKIEGPTTFAGEISAEAAKKIRNVGAHFQTARPSRSVRRAGCLAELGWQRLRQGAVDDTATLAPLYMRALV